MCDLCDKYGRKPLGPEDLKTAMSAVTKERLVTQADHLRTVIDAWMGFTPGAETDDPELAGSWERSHR
jgi:hypothetical protein